MGFSKGEVHSFPLKKRAGKKEPRPLMDGAPFRLFPFSFLPRLSAGSFPHGPRVLW